MGHKEVMRDNLSYVGHKSTFYNWNFLAVCKWKSYVWHKLVEGYSEVMWDINQHYKKTFQSGIGM